MFPFVILALTLALLQRPAWLWRTAFVYSILAGLLWVAAIVLVLLDESSTAALGILVIPVGVLAGMVPAVIVGFVVAKFRAYPERRCRAPCFVPARARAPLL